MNMNCRLGPIRVPSAQHQFLRLNHAMKNVSLNQRVSILISTLVFGLMGIHFVAPIPQEYLRRPLYAALQIREPDWESPRVHERFNQGGEFGSQRCVVFSGLDRGEMATVVSAIESRGLPRLITVVVTSENVELSLGEALATAVKESRVEAKRADEHRRKDYVAELKKLERKGAKEGLSVEQMVRREIERQDALEADEAARNAARDENATWAEARMRELRDEYARKELERREAAAVAGGTNDDPTRVANPLPDWPTAADTVDVDGEKIGDVDLGDLGVQGASPRQGPRCDERQRRCDEQCDED